MLKRGVWLSCKDSIGGVKRTFAICDVEQGCRPLQQCLFDPWICQFVIWDQVRCHTRQGDAAEHEELVEEEDVLVC